MEIVKIEHKQEKINNSINQTLQDFVEICENKKPDGIIVIALKKENGEERFLGLSSNLTYCQKIGMLEMMRNNINNS